jgi:shikimate kinase
MNTKKRIILTGFMGVGKSTVAKCLSHILRCDRIDLDVFIEQQEKLEVVEIIEKHGEEHFRNLERKALQTILNETEVEIVSLGGGTWIFDDNRNTIKSKNCTTVWLESSFEHCWRNINCSRIRRPLAKDRQTVEKLFNERQKIYCLADWHFVVKPQLTSFEVAKQIADEIF